MKKKNSVAIDVLVVLLLAAVLCWFHLPRSVDAALEAVFWKSGSGETELTTVHFSGQWTPDLMGGKATFRGDVWVDALEGTYPSACALDDLRFDEWSEGELNAFAVYRSVEDGTLLEQCAVTVYYYPAWDALWLQIQQGDAFYIAAAPFDDEADAAAFFDALNIYASF